MLGTLPFRFRQTALLHFQRARQMAEEGKGSKNFSSRLLFMLACPIRIMPFLPFSALRDHFFAGTYCLCCFCRKLICFSGGVTSCGCKNCNKPDKEKLRGALRNLLVTVPLMKLYGR